MVHMLKFLNRDHIKGDIFRNTLYLYLLAELVWGVLWFAFTMYILNNMTQGQYEGSRWATDFKDLIMHLTGFSVMIYGTARAHHYPEFLTLAVILFVVFYDIVVTLETFRFVSRVLPPSNAWGFQLTLSLYQVITSGFALIWYTLYSIDHSKDPKKRDEKRINMSYSRF